MERHSSWSAPVRRSHIPARAMRLVLAFLLLCPVTLPTVLHAGVPVHLWSQRFGGIGADMGFAVAADGQANVLITGSFYGTVNFGGGNLTGTGSRSVFVAKYDPSGAHVWSRAQNSTVFAYATSIAVDADGNVLIAGYFDGTLNLGGSDLVCAGGRDVFVAKYSAAGAHVWSKRFGGTSWESTIAVATDESGNVVIAGAFTGTVDFGGGNLVTDGSADVFLARYDSAGGHLWSQRFGGSGSDAAYGLAVEPSGDIVITGYFWGTADFGGGLLVSSGPEDAFVAKFNLHGEHQWSKGFGDEGYAVAIDAAGNVLVTGHFLGTADFGGGNLVSAGYTDVFVVKLDANGAHQWSRGFGGSLNEYAYGIAADEAGKVIVTGTFTGLSSFGGDTFLSLGETDGFVAKYDAAGAHQWSIRFGSFYRDSGRCVATDADGRVLLAGYFWGSVDLGGGTLTSAGQDDVLLVKFDNGRAEPAITTIADVGNDQGRRVKIRFARSGYDANGSSHPIVAYEIYRRDDPGWTFVGSAPAHQEGSYGLDVPTTGDAINGGPVRWSVFRVRAATASALVYYDSPADSGYSIDNLAPGVPTNFAYHEGVLTWDACPDADFDHFAVYGARTSCRCGAVLVSESVEPALDVGASPHEYYLLTATDAAGNESEPAVIHAGAHGAPGTYALSVSNYPNPFNPATTVHYRVPSRGSVTVVIYDAQGARVTTLVDREARDAGEYRVAWDGVTEDGARAASGMYFVRVEHNGVVRTRKMVMLK